MSDIDETETIDDSVEWDIGSEEDVFNEEVVDYDNIMIFDAPEMVNKLMRGDGVDFLYHASRVANMIEIVNECHEEGFKPNRNVNLPRSFQKVISGNKYIYTSSSEKDSNKKPLAHLYNPESSIQQDITVFLKNKRHVKKTAPGDLLNFLQRLYRPFEPSKPNKQIQEVDADGVFWWLTPSSTHMLESIHLLKNDPISMVGIAHLSNETVPINDSLVIYDIREYLDYIDNIKPGDKVSVVWHDFHDGANKQKLDVVYVDKQTIQIGAVPLVFDKTMPLKNNKFCIQPQVQKKGQHYFSKHRFFEANSVVLFVKDEIISLTDILPTASELLYVKGNTDHLHNIYDITQFYERYCFVDNDRSVLYDVLRKNIVNLISSKKVSFPRKVKSKVSVKQQTLYASHAYTKVILDMIKHDSHNKENLVVITSKPVDLNWTRIIGHILSQTSFRIFPTLQDAYNQLPISSNEKAVVFTRSTMKFYVLEPFQLNETYYWVISPEMTQSVCSQWNCNYNSDIHRIEPMYLLQNNWINETSTFKFSNKSRSLTKTNKQLESMIYQSKCSKDHKHVRPVTEMEYVLEDDDDFEGDEDYVDYDDMYNNKENGFNYQEVIIDDNDDIVLDDNHQNEGLRTRELKLERIFNELMTMTKVHFSQQSRTIMYKYFESNSLDRNNSDPQNTLIPSWFALIVILIQCDLPQNTIDDYDGVLDGYPLTTNADPPSSPLIEHMVNVIQSKVFKHEFFKFFKKDNNIENLSQRIIEKIQELLRTMPDLNGTLCATRKRLKNIEDHKVVGIWKTFKPDLKIDPAFSQSPINPIGLNTKSLVSRLGKIKTYLNDKQLLKRVPAARLGVSRNACCLEKYYEISNIWRTTNQQVISNIKTQVNSQHRNGVSIIKPINIRPQTVVKKFDQSKPMLLKPLETTEHIVGGVAYHINTYMSKNNGLVNDNNLSDLSSNLTETAWSNFSKLVQNRLEAVLKYVSKNEIKNQLKQIYADVLNLDNQNLEINDVRILQFSVIKQFLCLDLVSLLAKIRYKYKMSDYEYVDDKKFIKASERKFIKDCVSNFVTEKGLFAGEFNADVYDTICDVLDNYCNDLTQTVFPHKESNDITYNAFLHAYILFGIYLQMLKNSNSSSKIIDIIEVSLELYLKRKELTVSIHLNCVTNYETLRESHKQEAIKKVKGLPPEALIIYKDWKEKGLSMNDLWKMFSEIGLQITSLDLDDGQNERVEDDDHYEADSDVDVNWSKVRGEDESDDEN